jgi:hypothetical protein
MLLWRLPSLVTTTAVQVMYILDFIPEQFWGSILLDVFFLFVSF